MKSKIGQILLHVTGCIAFLSLPVLLSPDVSWNFHFIRVAAFREDFVTYTLLLLFFYLNYFSLIPNLYFKQKFFSYFFCILLSYVVVELVPHILIPGNHPPGEQTMRQAGTADFDPKKAFVPPPGFDKQRLTPEQRPPVGNGSYGGPPPPIKNGSAFMRQPDRREPIHINDTVFRHRHSPLPIPPAHASPGELLFNIPRFEYLFQFVIVLVLSTMIRINNRLKQSEKEKVNAELAYLKAQINPHFLFNTLNSIYASAIDENATNTASSVVKLAGLMRYVISEANHEYVPLEKELAYISNYIELQKIRLDDTIQVGYLVTGSPQGKQIAPLILISFIENAFKHGVDPAVHSGIDIDIDIHDNSLRMTVLNNKVQVANSVIVNSHVGMENTINRLQLLYPSRHELVVKDDGVQFLVMLKINLQ